MTCPDLDFDIAPSYSGSVCSIRFDKCGAPWCVHHGGCTYEMRAEVTAASGILFSQVFVRGKHADGFYPIPWQMKLLPEIRKNVATLLRDEGITPRIAAR